MRSLKSRASAAAAVLLAALIVAPASGNQHASTEKHISVVPSDLEWRPAPSVGPGAQIAVIEGDLKAATPFTFRLKLPPNFKVGVHTHPVYERVTVISGTFHLGIGETFEREKAKAYPAGGVAMMPGGMPMFAYTTEETIIQVHGTGPWGIKYLDPKDDPTKK